MSDERVPRRHMGKEGLFTCEECGYIGDMAVLDDASGWKEVEGKGFAVPDHEATGLAPTVYRCGSCGHETTSPKRTDSLST